MNFYAVVLTCRSTPPAVRTLTLTSDLLTSGSVHADDLSRNPLNFVLVARAALLSQRGQTGTRTDTKSLAQLINYLRFGYRVRG